MYHNVLLEELECAIVKLTPSTINYQGSHDSKTLTNSKGCFAQTDVISNKSTRTIRSIKTINLRGTTLLGTHLNLKKMGYAPI